VLVVFDRNYVTQLFRYFVAIDKDKVLAELEKTFKTAG